MKVTAERPQIPLSAGIADMTELTHSPTLERTQADTSRHHSTTSSARPSSVIGKVRQSALAVLKLRTSSIFTGCWTDRSAGFSPLRILPL